MEHRQLAAQCAHIRDDLLPRLPHGGGSFDVLPLPGGDRKKTAQPARRVEGGRPSEAVMAALGRALAPDDRLEGQHAALVWVLASGLAHAVRAAPSRGDAERAVRRALGCSWDHAVDVCFQATLVNRLLAAGQGSHDPSPEDTEFGTEAGEVGVHDLQDACESLTATLSWLVEGLLGCDTDEFGPGALRRRQAPEGEADAGDGWLPPEAREAARLLLPPGVRTGDLGPDASHRAHYSLRAAEAHAEAAEELQLQAGEGAPLDSDDPDEVDVPLPPAPEGRAQPSIHPAVFGLVCREVLQKEMADYRLDDRAMYLLHRAAEAHVEALYRAGVLADARNEGDALGALRAGAEAACRGRGARGGASCCGCERHAKRRRLVSGFLGVWERRGD